MRRTFGQRPDIPSKRFFIKLFRRGEAEVIVDIKRRDVYLTLRYKSGIQLFSVKRFMGHPATIAFPKCARKKCLEAFFFYIS